MSATLQMDIYKNFHPSAYHPKVTEVYSNFTNRSRKYAPDNYIGGGTFIGLGKVLKDLNPKSMTLYITHGIFSNEENIKELNSIFDNIVVAYDWSKM